MSGKIQLPIGAEVFGGLLTLICVMWIPALGVYALYKNVMRVREPVHWRFHIALLQSSLQNWSALTFRRSPHILELRNEDRLEWEPQVERQETSVMQSVC